MARTGNIVLRNFGCNLVHFVSFVRYQSSSVEEVSRKAIEKTPQIIKFEKRNSEERLQFSTWKNKEKLRTFFDAFAKKKNFTSLDDWYKISIEEFKKVPKLSKKAHFSFLEVLICINYMEVL